MAYDRINPNSAAFTDAADRIQNAATAFKGCMSLLAGFDGHDALREALEDDLINDFRWYDELHGDGAGMAWFAGLIAEAA